MKKLISVTTEQTSLFHKINQSTLDQSSIVKSTWEFLTAVIRGSTHATMNNIAGENRAY